MAVRGALRCDIDTTLSEDELVSIFEATLCKRRWARELFGNPSHWDPAPVPPDARAAAEWVRNKREERVHSMKPGCLQDAMTQLHVGTVIALGFDEAEAGRRSARLYTSMLKKAANGMVAGPTTIRNQMKRVASAITTLDPSAQVKHYVDAE